ncbi:His-Xaa-Ser system radical SAM maturase HxsB [Butyrivibrio sp. MC2013]|uniref:His-Xaa-Ser system radical SAM maturase HxsB n=1 Tax=Butyrivibrio sp. MC2013 TaxID=1280686 RepID=UPI0003F83047|nr:His-Xaa-Ser system radical SAM maturase HxsB [Butyrivibrio sp. MC2013]
MINYFNFKRFENDYLITNDFGRYSFVDLPTLKKLIQGNEHEISDSAIQRLSTDFFIIDEPRQSYLEKSIPHIRDIKNHLLQPTSLFIFVLTNTCNLNCVYCQAQSENSAIKGSMTEEIAEMGAEIVLQSPSPSINIEFQGGEPLINFHIIKKIIDYVDTNNSNKNITYSLVSNLSLLTDEIADYLADHKVQVSVSLDGNEFIHDSNRPFRLGGGSFATVQKGIEKLRARNLNIGAIQTTTKLSLTYPEEIVDSYIQLGFNSIFIRPLTRLGYAKDHWDTIGYSPEEFVSFYKKSLDHILKCNSSKMVFSEGHATIFLNKILHHYSNNYMELRSPCGASVGQLAIYYDGNIYTCDEGRMVAEMGDNTFKLGTVFTSDYDNLMDSNVTKAVCTASCLESIPECCDCVYQPFCGVCPVINYALEDDLFPKIPHGSRCSIYSGMLDCIFSILHKKDAETIDILERWLQ